MADKLLKSFLAISLSLTFLLLSIGVSNAEIMEVAREDRGRTIYLRPEIHWPPGTGPFGVVIVVNSSAGPKDAFLTVSIEPLTKAGIAVATLDTFTPRDVQATAVNQKLVSSTQMALDALFVAEALHRNSRVRPDKIALQGQSKGGVTALHAATEGWRQFVRTTKQPFDATIAMAPSCELQFRDPMLVSPLFALMGEKDDNTLPGPCVKLFERMKSAGQPVVWEVVEGANHAWSTYGSYLSPNLFSIRNCADEPYYYTRKGFESSLTGQVIAFRQIFSRCGARGYMIGGSHDKRPYVLERAVKWLKGMGW